MKRNLLESRKFLGAGLFLTIICCFTPVLVVLLGLAGLSWFTGYLDYGLTPLLGFFITALTLLLYSHSGKKYVIYLGGTVLLAFVGLYFIWGVFLGILVIAGAGIALLAYLPHFKKFCKTCRVRP